jgi:hypothetical protein
MYISHPDNYFRIVSGKHNTTSITILSGHCIQQLIYYLKMYHYYEPESYEHQ